MPIDLLCALEPKGLCGELKRRLEHANVLVAAPRMTELRAALRAGTPDMVVASTFAARLRLPGLAPGLAGDVGRRETHPRGWRRGRSEGAH